MALGPLGPGAERKEDLRLESRLMDRAHFLGDTARHSRSKAQEPTSGKDATTFQKTLKKKLDPGEAEETEEEAAAQPEGTPTGPAEDEKELKDPLAQEQRETE